MWLVAGVAGSLPERCIWEKLLENRQTGQLLLRQVAGMGEVVDVCPWIVGMVVVEGTV